MKLAGIQIEGKSVSGIGTALAAPELGVVFDCGLVTSVALRCQHVVITHGHLDHVDAICRQAALRAFSGNPKPSIFYVPPYLEDFVHEKFALTAKAQCRTDLAPYNVVVTSPGETTTLRKGLCLRPFETIHRIPSQGYVIYAVRMKIKAEFAELPGQEIGRLRKSGVEISDRVEVPLVAFTGDTQAKVFDTPGAADALRAKVLITECTYVGTDSTPAKARQRGHVHIDELAERAHLFQNQAVLLAHFSQKHNNNEVREAIASLPETLRAKVRFVPLPKKLF